MTHKTIIITLCAALLVAGCGKEQPKVEEKEYTQEDFDALREENRDMLALISDSTLTAADLCEPIQQFSKKLCYAVAHDTNFERNSILRAYARYLFFDLSKDTREIPLKCYEWLICASDVFTCYYTDSFDVMTTSLFRASWEIENRFASLVFCKKDGKDCMFVLTAVNNTDTVMRNLKVFFEGADDETLLALTSSNADVDYSEAENGIVHMIVLPADKVLGALKKTRFIRVQYDAPKERVVMEQFVPSLDYQRKYNCHARNIFGE